MKFRGIALATAILFLFCSFASALPMQNQSSTQPPSAPAQTPQVGQSPPPGNGGQSTAQPAPATTQSTAQPAASSSDSNDQYAAEPGQKADDQKSNDEAKKKKGSGGKDDVDAIGNRKMGGKGLGDWYSIDKEVRMGKQFAQQVEASVKLIQDPQITEYVNRIGQNLVRNSDAQVPFTIKVVDSDEVNAFALPGGFFYVNSGLILAADEEAELAGVMAHEIAHVAARHATRQMTRANWANFATLPLIFVPMGAGAYYGLQAATGLLVPATFMKFSRSFEAEADYLGLQYMYKTGYDPQAFISFFEKIQAQEKKKPGTLAKAFSSHPQTPDRIETSQKEIATILPARDQYVVSTSEFDQVKARLAALENRRKLNEDNVNKPSLRRASNTNDKDGNKKTDSGDDDRPTLKRRDPGN